MDKQQLYETIMQSVSKEVKKALNESYSEKWDGQFPFQHYSFLNKCNKMDADKVQDLTHWDETFCNNEYCIADEALDKIIYIIPYEQFDQMTEGEYKPREKNIEYCAYNYQRDVVLCLDKKGIHWFYN